ncbi:Rieske 2Fe-2S domain-containing protein [Streptomyces rubiginosohelvolus]|uniref:Rieske 2Fe-2S domain-containing protein n=1 Tax=Streptomyces rubiginosohelvolus TaxID=67362 RepID=UPI0035DA8482
MDRLEHATALDGLAGRLRSLVRAVPLGGRRDVLHGRWLGHPVHPLMVQVPIGTWFSAALLDILPGQRRSADALIGVGIAAALPAAVAGWTDWAELERRQMRVGLVHAAANATGVGLYVASLVARARKRSVLGKTLGFAGLTAVGLGGAIGGHLAYRLASGANHAESVPDLIGPGWHTVTQLSGLPVAQPVRRHIDDIAVLVVREAGDRVHVLADTCSHMGGPLSDGTLEDDCVRCPWHGSLFRLNDGWNVQGPATAPQPAFDVRITDGQVEARLRGPQAKDHTTPAGGEA